MIFKLASASILPMKHFTQANVFANVQISMKAFALEHHVDLGCIVEDFKLISGLILIA